MTLKDVFMTNTSIGVLRSVCKDFRDCMSLKEFRLSPESPIHLKLLQSPIINDTKQINCKIVPPQSDSTPNNVTRRFSCPSPPLKRQTGDLWVAFMKWLNSIGINVQHEALKHYMDLNFWSFSLMFLLFLCLLFNSTEAFFLFPVRARHNRSYTTAVRDTRVSSSMRELWLSNINRWRTVLMRSDPDDVQIMLISVKCYFLKILSSCDRTQHSPNAMVFICSRRSSARMKNSDA